MMQQNELAYVDVLADTYNRQFMNYVLQAWTARGRTFVGAMIDIDHFKSINDTYGHAEGDAALRVLTDAMKRSRLEGEWVFRYAGDEFIVLKLSDSPDGLAAYLSNMEKNLADCNSAERPYQIVVSYGTSFFCDGGSIDAFIKEMDDNMYAMKAKHHGAG